MENNHISWIKLPENKQLPGKYTSLINSIAIVLILTLILIYIAGGIVDFVEGVFVIVFGYTVSVDVIYTFINIIVHILIFAIPLKLFKSMHGRVNAEKYMPVEKEIVNKKTLVPIFLLGLSGMFLVWGITNDVLELFMDYTELGDDYLWYVGMKYNYQIIAYVVSIAVIPAIGEELLCRKLICDSLAPYGQKAAIIISSILFSLMHADFHKFLYTFVGGLFCAWLYVGTKKIWLSIALHFVNNLMSAIAVIIYYRVSADAYLDFLSVQTFVYLVIAIVCLIKLITYRRKSLLAIKSAAIDNGEYESYVENKLKYKNSIEMLPGEDGEEVIPISKKEKIKGFFSPINIIFIFCCVLFAWLKTT